MDTEGHLRANIARAEVKLGIWTVGAAKSKGPRNSSIGGHSEEKGDMAGTTTP